MANRFYLSFAPTPGMVVLQGPEARHLATIMRAKPGDFVTLFCGDGFEYPAAVESIGKRDVILSVQEAVQPNRELPIRIEVASAMPKGDRGDFLIEKLTELGVTRFVPLETERSIVHPRIERLQRAVIEASKQCGRNVLMEIGETVKWAEYCRSVNDVAIKWFAHIGSHELFPRPLTQGEWGHCRINIAVGPEGGWTDSETQLAIDGNWKMVQLGARILRIETAVIALASYLALSSCNRA